MNAVTKFITLLLVVIMAFAGSGCASFSKPSRQQRAYEKYIRKSSVARAKQKSQLRSDAPQMPSQPMPSEPMEASEVGQDSPQSMPTEG